MISKETVLLVRQRADFQCEYCHVTEIDCGGVLTVDHFIPTSKGGTDALDNLIYACPRCNLYKHDYYPLKNTDLSVFNPRIEVYQEHFMLLESGALHPLSRTADFSIQLLRLNRVPLIAYREAKKKREELQKQLTQLYDLTKLLSELNRQLLSQNAEQQKLLQSQNLLLSILLKRKN